MITGIFSLPLDLWLWCFALSSFELKERNCLLLKKFFFFIFLFDLLSERTSILQMNGRNCKLTHGLIQDWQTDKQTDRRTLTQRNNWLFWLVKKVHFIRCQGYSKGLGQCPNEIKRRQVILSFLQSRNQLKRRWRRGTGNRHWHWQILPLPYSLREKITLLGFSGSSFPPLLFPFFFVWRFRLTSIPTFRFLLFLR